MLVRPSPRTRAEMGGVPRENPGGATAGATAGRWGGRGTAGRRHTGGMQKSQPSGAKGFAILVGTMVAIVLVIMLIAVIFSPH